MAPLLYPLLFIVLLVTSLPSPALAGKRVALVVGNSAYEYTPPLRNPANDAKDLSVALTNLGFEVVTAFDVKAAQFDFALKQFAEKISDVETALFFYAGHGVQFSGHNYLVPVDARLSDEFSLKRETIAADDVVQLLEAGARINLVFLDACRNNPLTEQLKRSITTPTRAALVGRGLARMETSGGDTLIAFSTAPGEVASDGAGRNSLFAEALLRHVNSPGIDVEVMLKRVTDDVRKATKDRQRPERLSKLSKEFQFKLGDTVQPMSTAKSSNSPDEELAYWNEVKDSRKEEWLRGYLDRYPNGVFVSIARDKIRSLTEPAKPNLKRDAATAYNEAIAKGTQEALRAFAEDFPDDPHVSRVREILAIRLDEDEWKRASREDTPAAYRTYVATFPDGIHMENARRRIAALQAAAESRAAAVFSELPNPQGKPTSSSSFLARYYFVWDTQPPDDWLDLWEGPNARGRLIRHMPNGTALELLEKGSSKWYKFRIVKTGEVGWAAWSNGSGTRVWVYCCRTADEIPSYPRPFGG